MDQSETCGATMAHEHDGPGTTHQHVCTKAPHPKREGHQHLTKGSAGWLVVTAVWFGGRS